MTTERETAVRGLVESFREPYLGLDLGSAGAVQQVDVSGTSVRLTLRLGFPARNYAAELADAVRKHLGSLEWVSAVHVDVEWHVESQAV
ncbi:MAG TPA: iron-sulfur cluster assembly protein, partial [Povalibacter sp.]|nr:iron-sulfur cluster assembly protein [Povalibacter sp.]